MQILYFLKNSLNKKKLENIKLVVLDVDGVMTDGKLIYNGESDSKNFNVRDGLGIKILQKEEIKVVFLSGNKSPSILKRAKDLNIDKCFIGVRNKLAFIKNIQNELRIKKEQTLYCGDDLNDLIVLDEVKIFSCPRDASSNVKSRSDIILRKNGGEGSVRELCEMILKQKNLFNKYITEGFAEKN